MSLISALFTGWHRVLAAVERKGKTLLKVEGPLDLFCSLGCILGRHYGRLGSFSPVITSMVAQSGPRCGEGREKRKRLCRNRSTIGRKVCGGTDSPG